MQNNENKTKEELIKIIEQLEKKVEDLSSMQSYPVQERFREKYSTRILDDVDTELYVSGDWNRIIQIISNLLSNAAKFTPKGEIHFGYREKEDFVEFYVKDSGIGIPAERVATIFQRFGKINDFVQGTGLGLTLCRMLVEKMGGRIWLRSQEGKGSRFYFTLPLIRQ